MAYLDGELSPDRAASRHLELCRECQAIAADLQSVSRQMMAWQVETGDGRTLEGLHAALEEKAVKKSVERTPRPWLATRQLRLWIVSLASAAAIVIVLLTVSAPRMQLSKLSVDMVRPGRSAMLAARAQAVQSFPRTGQKTLIIRTAELTLTTSEFDRVRDRIEAILKRHQGYIGTLVVTAPEASARTL